MKKTRIRKNLGKRSAFLSGRSKGKSYFASKTKTLEENLKKLIFH